MAESRVTITRGVVAFAIVLFAIVSAPRIALDFAPSAAEPEVVASMTFPSTGDPMETTRRYVLPLESAIRSLGDVLATRGDVGADSATITIRFRRGVDPELKAARLTAELAPLRARLPQGASLGVWPSNDSGDRPSAVYALTGKGADDSASRISDELRGVAGVRDVQAFGATTELIDARLNDPRVSASQAASDLVSFITPHHLGRTHFAARQLPVVTAPAATNLRDTPLAKIATITPRRAEPRTVARLNGRPAVMLAVVRDADTSLFQFDDALRNALRARHAEEVWSDAKELRRVLVRLAIGAAIASIILGLTSGWTAALYIPLSIALFINLCRLMALRIDAYALLAAAIAIAGLAPLLAVRRARWAFVFALVPIIAIALASDALSATLAGPAKMFALAGLCAVLVERRLPSPLSRRPPGRRVQSLLRNGATVVLACLATSTLLLSWFGDRLDPRGAERGSERSRIYLHLNMPAGATLAQTIDSASRVEKALRKIDDVPRFWTWAAPGRATIAADLAPRVQTGSERDLLKLRLRLATSAAAGVVRIDDGYDTNAGRASGEVEDKPRAEEQAALYRVLLKGTDAASLRDAFELIATRLSHMNVPRRALRPEWPEGTTRSVLVPQRDVAPVTMTHVAASLVEQTTPPRPRTLPDGKTIVIAAANAPRSIDDVPRLSDLHIDHLGQFTRTTESVSGRVTRELGRFVLPVSIRPPGEIIDQRIAMQKDIDRTLALMTFAPGVVLERPSLAAWTFSREKLRLFALATLVPALLFALAAIILSSLVRALIALAPAVVGVAFASPALLIADAPLDEIALLAIAAACCCVVALAVANTLHGSYRDLRATFVPTLAAACASLAFLVAGVTARTDLGDAWRAPLLAAAVVLFAGCCVATILPSILLRVSLPPKHITSFASDVASRALDVQNVTKIYASGFKALHHVSFTLQPGIIGLLGPNGAGKTTLLRILTGLLLPTRGTVRFRGEEITAQNLADYRTNIGFLPQEFNAYAGLTAAQFLDYWSLERGITGTRARRDEVERLLGVARLEQHASRRLRDFSGGMRQRIGIARAMIGDPSLLVVDEPTTGLDIEARAHFRELITSLARDRIIIVSTHIASDVEDTASRLLLLARGRIVWDGAPNALVAAARGRVFETIASDADARELTRRHRITTRVRIANGVRLRGVVPEGETLPGDAVEPSLEEAYLAVIAPSGSMRTGSFAFVFETARA